MSDNPYCDLPWVYGDLLSVDQALRTAFMTRMQQRAQTAGLRFLLEHRVSNYEALVNEVAESTKLVFAKCKAPDERAVVALALIGDAVAIVAAEANLSELPDVVALVTAIYALIETDVRRQAKAKAERN